MIDSPEQGLVVCFGLACAGSVFGCRSSVGLRCVRWAYSDFGACFYGGSLHVMVEGEWTSWSSALAGRGHRWLAMTSILGPSSRRCAFSPGVSTIQMNVLIFVTFPLLKFIVTGTTRWDFNSVNCSQSFFCKNWKRSKYLLTHSSHKNKFSASGISNLIL